MFVEYRLSCVNVQFKPLFYMKYQLWERAVLYSNLKIDFMDIDTFLHQENIDGLTRFWQARAKSQIIQELSHMGAESYG